MPPLEEVLRDSFLEREMRCGKPRLLPHLVAYGCTEPNFPVREPCQTLWSFGLVDRPWPPERQPTIADGRAGRSA